MQIDCMVDGAGESGDNASFAIKLAVEPSAPLIIAARFTPPIIFNIKVTNVSMTKFYAFTPPLLCLLISSRYRSQILICNISMITKDFTPLLLSI